MNMYQKTIIIGNLGREPEMRYTPAGRPVTNFSVAANRKWKNGDGTQGEEVTWFKVVAWGNLAEVCNQYLSKGRLVMVEGRLSPDKETGGPRVWTGRDGVARAQYEVTAETVKFLGGRGGEHREAAAEEPTQDTPPLGDDEFPF
jgi:single-strand DNA-binding protein